MKIFLTGKNGQVGVEPQRVRPAERNRGGRSSGMQSCRCVCNSSLGERDTAQGHRQSGGLYGCGRGRDCAAPGVDHQRRGARHFRRGSGAHRCSRRATTFSMAARTAATPRKRCPIRSASTARPSLPANRRCPPAARNTWSCVPAGCRCAWRQFRQDHAALGSRTTWAEGVRCPHFRRADCRRDGAKS